MFARQFTKPITSPQILTFETDERRINRHLCSCGHFVTCFDKFTSNPAKDSHAVELTFLCNSLVEEVVGIFLPEYF